MPVGRSSGASGVPRARQLSLGLDSPAQLSMDVGSSRGKVGRFNAPTPRRRSSGGSQLSMPMASQTQLPVKSVTPPPIPRPKPPPIPRSRPKPPPVPKSAMPKPPPIPRGVKAGAFIRGNKGKIGLGAAAAFFGLNRMSSGRGADPGSQSLYR